MATTREHRYAVSLTWNGNLGTGTSFSSGKVSTKPAQLQSPELLEIGALG